MKRSSISGDSAQHLLDPIFRIYFKSWRERERVRARMSDQRERDLHVVYLTIVHHPVTRVAAMKTTRHSREKLQKTPRHAADLMAPSVEWDKSNADPAPSVTVFTNMAGAVSVTVDRESSTDAGRRLSSKLLPENLFNPFRDCRSKRRQLVPPVEKKSAAATGILEQNPHVTSAAAAAIAVEGIKKGVRDALDQWALQT